FSPVSLIPFLRGSRKLEFNTGPFQSDHFDNGWTSWTLESFNGASSNSARPPCSPISTTRSTTLTSSLVCSHSTSRSPKLSWILSRRRVRDTTFAESSSIRSSTLSRRLD
ncbi:hypothetical protein M405DRAFT_905140, partial [Rhizopogon salebrosus TDB-379]